MQQEVQDEELTHKLRASGCYIDLDHAILLKVWGFLVGYLLTKLLMYHGMMPT